jgi:hypothetical protein
MIGLGVLPLPLACPLGWIDLQLSAGDRCPDLAFHWHWARASALHAPQDGNRQKASARCFCTHQNLSA